MWQPLGARGASPARRGPIEMRPRRRPDEKRPPRKTGGHAALLPRPPPRGAHEPRTRHCDNGQEDREGHDRHEGHDGHDGCPGDHDNGHDSHDGRGGRAVATTDMKVSTDTKATTDTIDSYATTDAKSTAGGDVAAAARGDSAAAVWRLRCPVSGRGPVVGAAFLAQKDNRDGCDRGSSGSVNGLASGSVW